MRQCAMFAVIVSILKGGILSIIKRILTTFLDMKGHFRLAGLSRLKSCTLTYGKHENFFWPKVELSQEAFDALWGYCRDNWDEPKWGVIEFDGYDEDGEPINPKLVDISLTEK